MQLIVVMPVYNEQECIASVVDEWLALVNEVGDAQLLVIDDGSTDRTPQILEEHAAAGLRVVRQPNGGHGAAILAGYRIAIDAAAGWIVQTDSDGQIPASEFFRIWEQRQAAPFVTGARTARRDTSLRIHLSWLHQVLVRVLFGKWIRDPNVPFRLMQGRALDWYLRRIPAGTFAPNVLLSVLAAREKALRTVELHAHRARTTGTTSIRGWNTAKIAVRCLGQYIAFRRTLK